MVMLGNISITCMSSVCLRDDEPTGVRGIMGMITNSDEPLAKAY
jgi:hypothetical protein